jgi:hypothetical protein
MAYQIYKEIFGSDRFKKLATQGARIQRLLWASTGTKNPDYSDVKYVEALIGADTVNTAPVETLDAYRDHGEPKARLEQDTEEAYWVLEQLPELGISIDQVTQQLEDEGVEKFNQPFDKLMETLAHSTDEVWRQLDPELWKITHNPWVVLQTASRDKIERVLADPIFRKNVDRLIDASRQATQAPAWFQRDHAGGSAHLRRVFQHGVHAE